jgi:hypothetical protein
MVKAGMPCHEINFVMNPETGVLYIASAAYQTDSKLRELLKQPMFFGPADFSIPNLPYKEPKTVPPNPYVRIRNHFYYRVFSGDDPVLAFIAPTEFVIERVVRSGNQFVIHYNNTQVTTPPPFDEPRVNWQHIPEPYDIRLSYNNTTKWEESMIEDGFPVFMLKL